jgi:hypothetical protein
MEKWKAERRAEIDVTERKRKYPPPAIGPMT